MDFEVLGDAAGRDAAGRDVLAAFWGGVPPISGEKLAATAPSFLAVVCHALAAGK